MPVKINMVLRRGGNDHCVLDMAERRHRQIGFIHSVGAPFLRPARVRACPPRAGATHACSRAPKLEMSYVGG